MLVYVSFDLQKVDCRISRTIMHDALSYERGVVVDLLKLIASLQSSLR